MQRVLSARSLAHARAGCVAAGYAKLLPPLIIVLPGIAARVLFERCRMHGEGRDRPDGGWCTARLDEPDAANAAYPEMIVREFPPGMVGLMISAMVCAMMSSLSSNFNSASTVFTCDVYHRFLRPAATERELLWCGRITTAFVCVLSLAWLPVVQRQRGEFYLIVQNASSHIAPSLATVVTLGIVWKRVNQTAAFGGLSVGATLGLVQYGVSLAKEAECRAAVVGTTIGGPQFACMHFLHVAVIICAVTLTVTVLLTVVGTPPPASVTESTTVHWASCLRGSAAPRRDLSPHVQMVDHDVEHDHGVVEMAPVRRPSAAPSADVGWESVPETSTSRHGEKSAMSTQVVSPLAPANGAGPLKSGAPGGVQPAAALAAQQPQSMVDSGRGQLFVRTLGVGLIAIVLALVVRLR